jgi:hypothetical protein
MAHAYTPGLRVTRRATIRKRRQLPLQGEVLVEAGDRVDREQVVARAELPGDVAIVNLVNKLGVTPAELPGYMLKQVGDAVQEGEPIAETRPFIKWFRTSVSSSVTGSVESISSVTGQVLLRKQPRPVQVSAYVAGEVVEVLPGEGVVVETSGAYVQGIFGVGGERWGPLQPVADAPDADLDPKRIDATCRDQILVCGGLVGLDAVRRAQEVGAAGVIGGGIRDQDLRELLGFDLGVAITGTENLGLSLIVTEGFGRIAMARKTFDILTENAGRTASISGATQIRAGVVRPEIIITDAEAQAAPTAAPEGAQGLAEGALLRAIRAPYFGKIGQVLSLPAELEQVESGARVRVLEVAFEDGTRAIVPRANVELIEE